MKSYFTIKKRSIDFIDSQTKKETQLSFFRFAVAIVFFILLYSTIKNDFSNYLVASTLLFFFLFLYLVKRHQIIIDKIKFQKSLYQVCQNEISVEIGDIKDFLPGDEYIDVKHPFSYDLDLFGKNSIFQLLNRGFTKHGRDTLAQWLMFPLMSKEDIKKRQLMVVEMKQKSDWILEFLAEGNLIDENISETAKYYQWLQIDNNDGISNLKFMIWLVPIWSLSILMLTILGILSPTLGFILVILQANLLTFFLRKTNDTNLNLKKHAIEIFKYVPIFKCIEQQTFENEELKNDLLFLKKKGGISLNISKIREIDRISLMRKSFFGSMIINSFFPLDLYCTYRYNSWKKENGTFFLDSLSILHKWEAIISITNFSIINETYIFPQIDDNTILQASQIGHPLITKDKNIKNDININPSFFIVTGANMAGKSTFLRTIGTNLVLAMAGCPVCAESFVFKAMPIFTCMRIDDSISEGKSYFHAELTRLKQIVQLLETNEHVFIILDELLKGTNSLDKLKGSELFLEKLMNFNKCYGLIASHDLALTNMSQRFPDKIKNICFEVSIDNDIMNFNYKVNEGVTKNMNALFLMKQMQII